jgi:hypothetical protein
MAAVWRGRIFTTGDERILAILAVSLTILRSLSAIFLIGIRNLWLDCRNTKRYAREQGLG